MPRDPQQFREFLEETISHVRNNHRKERAALHSSIQQFWTLIETSPDVRMMFSMMLEQVPLQYPYDGNPVGGPEFRNWEEMLLTFDYQLTRGPLWLDNTPGQQALVGFPFNALLVCTHQPLPAYNISECYRTGQWVRLLVFLR